MIKWQTTSEGPCKRGVGLIVSILQKCYAFFHSSSFTPNVFCAWNFLTEYVWFEQNQLLWSFCSLIFSQFWIQPNFNTEKYIMMVISLWPIWNLILNQKVLTHFLLSLESSDIIGSVNWQNYLAYIKFIEFLIYFFSHDT